jgi:hypothetical protein
MKHILFTIFTFLTLATFAQRDTIATYDAPVYIQLPPDTIDNLVFKRVGELETIIWNRRTKNISFAYKVQYLTDRGNALRFVQEQYVQYEVTADKYVLPDGTLIGSLQDVQTLFGTQDKDGNWLYNQKGIMSEWDYMQLLSKQAVPLHDILTTITTRPNLREKIEAIRGEKEERASGSVDRLRTLNNNK